MSGQNSSIHQPQLSNIWLRTQHELLYISWGLMEVALFTPISFALLGWARYWPSGLVALWMILIMFLPFNLARLLTALHLPPPRQQTVMAVTLLLIILISIRTLIYAPQSIFDFFWIADFFDNIAEPDNQLWFRDVGIFFVIIIMWWRGLRLINRQFDIDKVGFRFRLGIILVPIAIILNRTGPGWDVTPFILLFFLASLMEITLVRVEQLEQSRSGFSAYLSPRWLSLIFAATLFTVGASGLLAAIISGKSLFAITVWLAPLAGAFYIGGVVAMSTILHLAQPLLRLFSTFIDWLALWLQQLFLQIGIDDQALPALNIADTLVMTPEATEVVEVASQPGLNTKIMAVLLMVALVLVTTLALRRLFRQATFAARDSELISTKGLQEDDELGLGRRLLQRLGLFRRWWAAASVRRIYQNMLKAAEGSGFPRADSETPYEFQTTLAQIWPENTADSQLITQAFVGVRYGELPETQAELIEIQAAWERLSMAQPTPVEQAPHLEKRLPQERFPSRN